MHGFFVFFHHNHMAVVAPGAIAIAVHCSIDPHNSSGLSHTSAVGVPNRPADAGHQRPRRARGAVAAGEDTEGNRLPR